MRATRREVITSSMQVQVSMEATVQRHSSKGTIIQILDRRTNPTAPMEARGSIKSISHLYAGWFNGGFGGSCGRSYRH